MFVHAYFVLCLHRDWFCELTWENVNIWEQFWNVHLLMTLIVLRWPSAVDRTLNSSYQLVCVLWPPDLIQQRTGHHWEPRGEANEGGVHSYRRQEADHVHGRFQHAGQGHVWVTATSGADSTVDWLWLLVQPHHSGHPEDFGRVLLALSLSITWLTGHWPEACMCACLWVSGDGEMILHVCSVKEYL